MRAKRLVPGDKVGIVSPSTPVTSDLEKQLQGGVAFLGSLGLERAPGEPRMEDILLPIGGRVRMDADRQILELTSEFIE